MRVLKSAKPEAEEEPPAPAPAASRREARRREENVNPPHNKPKDNLTAEERARRIKEANRAYFKAAGKMEDFYLAYPSERPPEREPKPERQRQDEAEPQRERGGRGGR